MFVLRDDHFELTITSHFAIVYRQLRRQIYLTRPIIHMFMCYKSVVVAGKANDSAQPSAHSVFGCHAKNHLAFEENCVVFASANIVFELFSHLSFLANGQLGS